MAARKPSGDKYYKFRNNEEEKSESKGTKATRDPITISETFFNLVTLICQRIIFFNTNQKVAIYATVMLLSLIFDWAPFPRIWYFSSSSNVFNQYFVKIGWFWTLITTVPFVLMTSFTYCCGQRRLIFSHLARLLVATSVWFIFTKSFVLYENSVGRCVGSGGDKIDSKQSCLSKGLYWKSFEISGHAFMLIYSGLVLVEEARAYIGWSSIQDMIRNEDDNRKLKIDDLSSPFKDLTPKEYGVVKMGYATFTRYVRVLFVIITFLSILWDIMLISTALYFHTMPEKLIAAAMAILVWFFTYRILFKVGGVSLPPPGHGCFVYNKQKTRTNSVQRNGTLSKSRSSIGNTFMGLPLKTGKKLVDDSPSTPIRTRPVTRSQNKLNMTPSSL